MSYGKYQPFFLGLNVLIDNNKTAMIEATAWICSSNHTKLYHVNTHSIITFMKYPDLSQSDRSNCVMWQVKDACSQPGWDWCLTRNNNFYKNVKNWYLNWNLILSGYLKCMQHPHPHPHPRFFRIRLFFIIIILWQVILTSNVFILFMLKIRQ